MSASENVLAGFVENLQTIADSVAAIGRSLTPIAQGLVVLRETTSRLNNAGWLPHHTTPFKLVFEADPNAVDALLSQYYQAEWETVRQRIVSRAETYLIDTEAISTFNEALTAHGLGMYRSTCRVLFPEIERVSRIEVHGGDDKAVITSQKDFIGLVRRLPAGFALRDPWAFELYSKLTMHLYEKVTSTNVAQFESIPNRHAAIHGRIVYRTLKNSINTIIMADYIFAVISAIKNYAQSTGQAAHQ
jgi:hypothetical protein